MTSARTPDTEPDQVAPTDRRSLGATAQTLVLAFPVAVLVAGGWAYRWMVDDGFIYLRVVQQVVAGNGPVFNEGQRVEAHTSPLWLALLSVADLVTPLRLEWIAVLLGIALSAVGLVLAIRASRVVMARDEPDAFVVPFGALALVALVPMWIFQTSGLEMGLVFAWLGAGLFVLVRWAESEDQPSTLSAVILGLGWLVRPELALFSAVLLVTILAVDWRGGSWNERGRLVGAAVALPLAYQLFRMGYYGTVVANPAIAKEASTLHWDRGWDYLVDFARPYWLWVPAVVIALGGYLPLLEGLRRLRANRLLVATVAFAGAGLLHATYIVAVGGDWLHARLLLPALFAVLAPVAVVPLTRRHVVALALAPWALVAAVGLRPPQLGANASIVDPFVLPSDRSGTVTIDDRGWGADGPRRQWYEGPHYYVSDGLARDPRRVDLDGLRPEVSLPVAALRGIGAAGYALGPDLHVIDTLGLANTLAAHMEATPGRALLDRKPGHEKPLPAVWTAAILTDEGTNEAADFPESSNPAIAPTAGAEFNRQVAWARATLDCPDIVALTASVSEPMGAGRFLENLFGSVSRTRLRIPPEPEQAYRRFCGSGTPDEVRALDS